MHRSCRLTGGKPARREAAGLLDLWDLLKQVPADVALGQNPSHGTCGTCQGKSRDLH